jgi:uncharacterized protein YecT (DUF1311 family)
MLAITITLMMSQVAPHPRFERCVDASAGVTAAMLDCGRQEIGRWDGRLNAAYQALLKTLPPSDKARLRIEQRAWLARHLRETRRLAADPDEGSVAFLQSQDFELQDLSARTIELERRLAHH